MTALAILLLTGCSQTFSGSLVGDAPADAQVLLLWPGEEMGRVGGIGTVSGDRFEIDVRQPGDNHPGRYYGTLVLYDGEASWSDEIAFDDITRLLGAAPRHVIVDANSTCSGVNCDGDDTFESGLSCGECALDGTCTPVPCKQVEVVVGSPLGLDWAPPGVDPVPAWFAEDGRVIAPMAPVVQLFPVGGVGASVFRDDLDYEVTGVHVGAQVVGARLIDRVGQKTAVVRRFDGGEMVELREDGVVLVDGPLLSPDGQLAGTLWADDTVRIHATDGSGEVLAVEGLAGEGLVWGPDSGVLYVLPGSGQAALAIGAVPGAVADDYPTCADAAGSPTLDPCGPKGEGGLAGMALGWPVLLTADCDGIRFADAPRSPSAVPVQTCAGGTSTGSAR